MSTIDNKRSCCDVPGNYYAGAQKTCGCNRGDSCPIPYPSNCSQNAGFDDSFALAMGYVPVQRFSGISPCEEGLKNGTVFPELVKPFCGAGRRKC